MKNSFYIIPLLCLTLAAGAQDFKRQYKHAKELFDDGSYNLAMEAFKPLITYDKNNPYSEYASFYYAVAAQRPYPAVARDMFVQIRKLYPSWDQIDEVNLSLARLYFDQHEYFQALLILDEIRKEDMRADVKAMKRHYLKEVDDSETLEMMLEEHPDDEEVGRALAFSIAKQPYLGRDHDRLEQLILKFNLPRQPFEAARKPVSLKKDRYRISLLFPFLAESLEPSPLKKKNQFVLDLYQGMKLAVDTLARQGINIDLVAYDTERNPEVLQKLLESEELKSTDLIVGPLFPEEVKAVQEFSLANKINMINPMSNNSEFMGENPFAMLYQPSHETLGIKSAELLAGRIKNKNCIVFFGDSPKDSVMAFSFMKRALELDMKVVLAQEFNKETSSKIISILATPTERDEYKNPTQFTLKKDSIGSIFVASDNLLIYTKVISSVETRSDSTIIVGMETWLDNSSNYETYERLHIMLAAPNYCTFSGQNYVDFRRNFLKRHGTFSDKYYNHARIGYEFMTFVARALNQYGVYFQLALGEENDFPGYLSPGFNYHGSRDNHKVPFTYFRGGEFLFVEGKQGD